MPKISIIVPVYNAAKLVPRCIASILSQTLSDFELIVVDDGSTDNSLEILTAYATKDPRITVLKKTNGGQTSARKFGVEHSHGEYLNFVDADDILPKNSLEDLFNHMHNDNLDMVQCASISYYEDMTELEHVSFPKTGVFGSEEFLEMMYHDEANNGTHANLYKRSLFNQHTYDIPFDVKTGEDFYINMCLGMEANRIGIYNDIVYYYIENQNSITHNYKFTSIRPQEHKLESIKRELMRKRIFEKLKVEYYQHGLKDIVSACLHNKSLIYDGYVKQFAKESSKCLSSSYDKGLIVMLCHPVLYEMFHKLNRLRQIIQRLK